MGSEAVRRVIIVEDEPFVYEMLADFFEERGYEIVAQEQFLDQAAGGGRADVIISDNRLGHSTGLELIAAMAGRGWQVAHRALISGAFTAPELEWAAGLGCRTFRKPFSLRDLESWLDEIERDPVPREDG
jgi:DNA-binding response OmpR family regulator